MDILIIDDAPVIHKSIQRALKHSNLTLHHAYNGKEGLRLFYEVKPVVTIVDLRMPKMDGKAVIKEIKPLELFWQKIIVLTGHGEDKEIRECYELGVHNFMKKPFNIFALRGLINAAVSQMENYKHIKEQQELMGTQKLNLAYQLSAVEMSAKFIHKLGNLTVPLRVGSQMLAENLPEILKVADHVKQAHNLNSVEEYKDLNVKVAAVLNELYQDYTESSEMIEDAVVRTADIIDSQQRYWKPRTLDVSSIFVEGNIENVAQLCRAIFQSGISIETDLDLELMEIQTIRLYFVQMLYNLIQNSIEAIGERQQEQDVEGRILIRTRKLDRNQFSLSVRDNGIGIPVKYLDRIHQDGFTTKENRAGNGLYFAFLFAEYLNGELAVSSDGSGKGTKITLKLPIYVDDSFSVQLNNHN